MKRKITFGAVRAEGYRSYISPTVYPLKTVGLHVITGNNGAGKTTLFSVICWVLFKVNLFGVANDKVVTKAKFRPKSFKGTRGIVVFDDGKYEYMVARHIKYTGTTLGLKGNSTLAVYRKPLEEDRGFSAEDMVGDELYKKDQQAYIERVLGMNALTFINSILFGQKMQRLVKADNSTKRELFERVFSVDFLTGMQKNAEVKKEQLEIELRPLVIKKETLAAKIDAAYSQYASDTQTLEYFSTNKEQELEQLYNSLEAYRDEYKPLLRKRNTLKDKVDALPKSKPNDLYKVLEQAREAYNKVAAITVQQEYTLAGYRRELEKAHANKDALFKQLNSTVSGKCPTCGQDIKGKTSSTAKITLEENIKKEVAVIYEMERNITKQVKVLEQSVEERKTANKAMNTAEAAYDKQDGKEASTEAVKDEYDEVSRRVDKLKNKIELSVQAIERLEEKEPPKIDLSKQKKHIAELEKEHDKVAVAAGSLTSELERVVWWLKNALSAKGLKANIFSAMLNQLNHYAQSYAPYLGFQVRHWVDMSKETRPFVTTCYDNEGNEFDYDELSGGQQQRIDVCLAFAMYDMITEGAVFSFVMFDEVWEGLDEEGVEMVFELIRLKARKTAVYLVTHNVMLSDMCDTKTVIKLDANKNSVIS